MKKLIMGAICVVFLGASLFAQVPAGTRDGIYFAQDANFTNNQRNQVVLEVRGGRITSANWNLISLNAGSQDLKSIARAQGAPAGATTWVNNATTVENFVVQTQNINATTVPNVPATFSVAPFFSLVRAALATQPIQPGGLYRDGWYFFLEPNVDDYHTRNYVVITVAGSRIVDVIWNGVLQGMPSSINPSKLITSTANRYPMTGSRSPWHTQANLTAAELVRVQNPDQIRLRADRRPDAISGVTIEIDRFIDVSRNALRNAR